MDILSVGEIVIDFLPGGPGVYIRKPGGAPANVAVAMSRLGRGAAFCGCAGDDDFDLILVTHSHIFVIELKNWRGKLLTSQGGNWYVDGQPRGRSPVPLVNLKAKRLGSTLNTRLGAAKTPLVLSFYPTDGNARGILALIHGLGDYSGCFTRMIDFFVNHGFSVAAIDMHGNGAAGGQRGHIDRYDLFYEDIELLP